MSVRTFRGFLDLPAELREAVYSEAIPQERDYCMYDRSTEINCQPERMSWVLPLSNLNHQVRAEWFSYLLHRWLWVFWHRGGQRFYEQLPPIISERIERAAFCYFTVLLHETGEPWVYGNQIQCFNALLEKCTNLKRIDVALLGHDLSKPHPSCSMQSIFERTDVRNEPVHLHFTWKPEGYWSELQDPILAYSLDKMASTHDVMLSYDIGWMRRERDDPLIPTGAP